MTVSPTSVAFKTKTDPTASATIVLPLAKQAYLSPLQQQQMLLHRRQWFYFWPNKLTIYLETRGNKIGGDTWSITTPYLGYAVLTNCIPFELVLE